MKARSRTPIVRLAGALARGTLRRRTTSLLLATLAVAVHGQTSAPTAGATTPAPTAAPDADNSIVKLDQLVVTGSVQPQSRLATPLAITTIDPLMIAQLAPRSVDELMKVVPGIYLESTGGEANNTVTARGIGAGSGFRYAVMLEDGLPVISEEDTSFSTADNYTRVSTWIASVEGLRGGSSGVFTSNAPIASINFIGREGTQTRQGEYKLEFGDYGLIRNDGWISGPIDANDTYAIGGFYRVDNGIRSPGFKADKGGQLTASFKHTFDDGKGYFKITSKVLNDRTEFLLPIPLTGTSSDPHTIPGGPDLHKGATSSPDMRFFSFPNSPIGALNYDLADGIQVDLNYIGSELQYVLGDGLKVENRNRYAHVDKSWNSNPFGQPDTLQTIANSFATGGNVPASTWAAALQSNGNYAFQLSMPGQGGSVVAANAGAAANLNGNGLGVLDGYWFSGAKMHDFQDDLRLIGSFNGDQSSITLGVYLKTHEETKLWQWEQELLDVSKSYRRLDLTYLNATTGAPIGTYTWNGVTQVGTLYRHGTADIDEVSPYLDATHRVGPLSLDAGVRLMNFTYKGSTEGTKAYDLNSYAQTTGVPALMNATFGNGNYTTATATEHKQAYTAGANYTMNRRFAAFARYSYGPRLPNTDVVIANGTGNTTPGEVETIKQYEAGIKYGNRNLALFLTAFYEQQRNVLNNGFQFVNGVPVQTNFNTGLNVPGLELEADWTPLHGFSIDVRATVQQPKLVTPGLVQIGTVYESLNGLTPTRTPKEYGTIIPSYTFDDLSFGRVTVNASWAYTGERPGNQNAAPNRLPLAAFSEIGAGVAVVFHNGVTLRVNGSNLLNSAGLTEQDPRLAAGAQVGSYFNARPLLPRSFVASLSYQF